jgi:glutamine synthetase
MQALIDLLSEGQLETVIAAFPDNFGRLSGKRFEASYFLDQIVGNGFGVTAALSFGYDIGGQRIANLPMTSAQSSFREALAVPDLQTLRVANWLDGSAIVLCDIFSGARDAPVDFVPRTLLSTQTKAAIELGFQTKGAAEVEFYLFREPYEDIAARTYDLLTTAGSRSAPYSLSEGTADERFIRDIRDNCRKSGIAVEGSHVELGPGQHEINFVYSELLEMADRVTLYKHVVKELGHRHGRAATFMAKWHEAHIGSSMHTHLSLWDPSGEKSLFASGDGGSSCAFRHFLGGLVKHAREVFPFFAPFPTSYKRFRSGGTAGLRLAWGTDNRRVGFRVLGAGNSLRIECRVPGADANPYLVFAALLASGLDGLKNEIEPPPPGEGPDVPATLEEAIEELRGSAWARKALSEAAVEHYLCLFDSEARLCQHAVTTWERARYFQFV